MEKTEAVEGVLDSSAIVAIYTELDGDNDDEDDDDDDIVLDGSDSAIVRVG